MPNQQKIKLADIVVDDDLQPRAGMNRETIEDYAADMQRGDQFPAVVVFYDGKTYWLADGFHRYQAACVVGSKTILCEVRRGGKRDAVLFSVSSNAAHGLRRSKADKRMAVTKLLEDRHLLCHAGGLPVAPAAERLAAVGDNLPLVCRLARRRAL